MCENSGNPNLVCENLASGLIQYTLDGQMLIVGSQFTVSTQKFSDIVFVLANGLDPDKMPRKKAFYLSLHWLPKYSWITSKQRVINYVIFRN